MDTKVDTPQAQARQIAEQAREIVMHHDLRCAGELIPDAPWCSVAPEGHPLCSSCQQLADLIARALTDARREEAAAAIAEMTRLMQPSPDGDSIDGYYLDAAETWNRLIYWLRQRAAAEEGDK